MGKIVVTEFITLDGVIEDPGGAEGFVHGGWSFKFGSAEGYKFKLDELMAADAQLLGRKTYQGFAKAWPTMSGNPFDRAARQGAERARMSCTSSIARSAPVKGAIAT